MEENISRELRSDSRVLQISQDLQLNPENKHAGAGEWRKEERECKIWDSGHVRERKEIF